MRLFDDLTADVRTLVGEARAYAIEGGQALHVWRPPSTGWSSNDPAVFRRAASAGRPWAHLFDLDRDRLRRTAWRLGVRRVVLHGGRRGRPVHVDLCGKPLERAIAECHQTNSRNTEPPHGSA